MSVWDEVGVASGEFVKFEAVGDSVAGTVTGIGIKVWDDGSKAPQLELATDDGEQKTLTAGQIRLKAALAEKRPEVGDHLTVALTQIEKRAGNRTLKHFNVEVVKGGKKAVAAAQSRLGAMAGGTAAVTDEPPF